MSILSYFTRTDKKTSSNVVIPTDGVPGISDKEIMNITDQIQSTSGVKRKRFTYSEQDKMKIVKYANECGLTRAVGKYKGEFPSLLESTVNGWLNKYRSQLEAKVQSSQIVISEKRGLPIYLPDELDKKLRTFITHMRMAGGTINHLVISGVLLGLIKSDLVTYGMYLEFQITDGWIQSLYRRMNLTHGDYITTNCYKINMVGNTDTLFTRCCSCSSITQYSRRINHQRRSNGIEIRAYSKCYYGGEKVKTCCKERSQ